MKEEEKKILRDEGNQERDMAGNLSQMRGKREEVFMRWCEKKMLSDE